MFLYLYEAFSLFFLNILLFENTKTIWYLVTIIRYSNIIQKIQMDQIPNMNSTIWSQLFEYRIIWIIRCNSVCCLFLSSTTLWLLLHYDYNYNYTMTATKPKLRNYTRICTCTALFIQKDATKSCSLELKIIHKNSENLHSSAWWWLVLASLKLNKLQR